MTNILFCNIAYLPYYNTDLDNVVPQRSCPSCNNIVADDDMFCPECGTKID